MVTPAILDVIRLYVPATAEQEIKVSKGITGHDQTCEGHAHIPNDSGKFKVRRAIRRHNRQLESLIGKNQEERQRKQLARDVQDVPRPSSGDHVGDEIHDKMLLLTTQLRRANENHPCKQQFDDLVRPSHGKDRDDSEKYSGGDEDPQHHDGK